MTEAIEVEARQTSDGRLRPVAFHWRGQRLVVHAFGREWRSGETEHMLVQVAGERVFELAHQPADGTWRLLRAPHDFGPPTARV
jgi:hypothetical protein